MSRLLVIAPLIVIVLDVFAIVDVFLVEKRRVRAMPKWVWVVLIVLVPVVGALLWFFVGRDRSRGGAPPRPVAPDDDPTFLRNLRRDEEQDERIRRLEQELADLDDDPPRD
ncbi:MAG: PLDc N-terminal domain-containing protein [Rhodoglobus sp.]